MIKRKQTYSRLLAYKRRQLKKKLFWYSLITTALITLIVLYGLSYLPAWVGFITNLVNRNQQVIDQTEVNLLPPTIQPLSEYINTSKPEIKGTAMPGKVIEFFLDGNKIGETISDKSGRFDFTPSHEIADGKHKLTAQLKEGKYESDLSLPVVFIVDTTSPELVIESPHDGDTLTFVKDDELVTQVKGQSEAGVEVKVNERIAKVDVDGSFIVEIPLKEGDNEIKAVSMDKAGNSTEKTIKVKVKIR